MNRLEVWKRESVGRDQLVVLKLTVRGRKADVFNFDGYRKLRLVFGNKLRDWALK
jgi:hypothetical protein